MLDSPALRHFKKHLSMVERDLYTLNVHTATGKLRYTLHCAHSHCGWWKTGTSFTSILLEVERDTHCTFILLAVEKHVHAADFVGAERDTCPNCRLWKVIHPSCCYTAADGVAQ
jgi:hypothetical protein